MSAGTYEKRIIIQRRILVKGAGAGHKYNFADVCTPRARVRGKSGVERKATSKGGEIAEARTEFAIRYRPGITEDMRVIYKGRFYNIKHVLNVNEGNYELLLTCDTGANDG